MATFIFSIMRKKQEDGLKTIRTEDISLKYLDNCIKCYKLTNLLRYEWVKLNQIQQEMIYLHLSINVLRLARWAYVLRIKLIMHTDLYIVACIYVISLICLWCWESRLS
jgi:hypothetical protein